MMRATYIKKSLFVLSLWFITTLSTQHSDAQSLLNRYDSEIKTYEAKVGGILRAGQASMKSNPIETLVYLFPARQRHENDTLIMTFFLRHDKCYKYIITYKNQNELPFLIKSYGSSIKFKRSGSDLKWLNTQENYFIEIQKQVNLHTGEDAHFAMVIYDNPW